MIARYVRPVSVAARWSRRLSVLAMLLFAVAGVSHRTMLLHTPDFFVLAALAGGLAGCGILLAVVGFWRLWQVGAKGGLASLSGLVCAAVVLAPVGYQAWFYTTRPHAFFVTTSPSDAPRWIEAPSADQQWMPRRETDASADGNAAYPDISSRRYGAGLEQVLAAVKRVAAGMRLQIVSEVGTPIPDADDADPPAGPAQPDDVPSPATDPQSTLPDPVEGPVPLPVNRPVRTPAQEPAPLPGVMRLQAVKRSGVFGFITDAVIRLTRERDGTLVDMRVSARYGDFDPGVDVIRSLFDALDSELPSPSANADPSG